MGEVLRKHLVVVMVSTLPQFLDQHTISLAKMLDTLGKLELRVRRLVMAPRSSRRPRCARSSSCSLGAPTSRKGGAAVC